jgi:Putative lumazine-binding
MSKSDVNGGRTITLGVIGVVFALVLAEPGPVRAQEAEVLEAVNQVFEGMRTADSATVRAVFSSEARFAIMDTREGESIIVAQSVDRWLDAIDASEGKWDEQVYDLQILVDGEMASAWVPYTFYLDGVIRHCGINSIELLKDSDGWKVTQLSDTRRTEGCPDPLAEPTPTT